MDTHTEVYFAKSVPMSTYLACFIVSDFQSRDVVVDTKGIGDPFDLRVFATPEQINKVDFAVEVGKGVIEYYVQYFQIPYPLPKLGKLNYFGIFFYHLALIPHNCLTYV